MRTKDIHNKILTGAMLFSNTVCKVRAKLSLCSITHHAMQTYKRNEGIAPYIPDEGEWSA
jgi:hypothetical protein